MFSPQKEVVQIDDLLPRGPSDFEIAKQEFKVEKERKDEEGKSTIARRGKKVERLGRYTRIQASQGFKGM